MERGTRFELAHPRVEALVHSLFYATPAKFARVFYRKTLPCQKNYLNCPAKTEGKTLFDLHRRSEELRFHSEKQIGEDVDPSELLSDIGLQGVSRIDILRIESDRIQSESLRYENRPAIVEFLRDDDEAGLSEYPIRPNHGIVRPESGMIEEDPVGRYAYLHEAFFHGLRFVVVLFRIIAAHHDEIDFPGIVDPLRSRNPMIVVDIPESGRHVFGSAEQHSYLAMGDVRRIRIYGSVGRPFDRLVAGPDGSGDESECSQEHVPNHFRVTHSYRDYRPLKRSFHFLSTNLRLNVESRNPKVGTIALRKGSFTLTMRKNTRMTR